MQKIKLKIKNRFTGSILFEYEKEDNTIKQTVLEALKDCADLGGADLRGANLRDADLRGADLGGADLGGADLRGANLRDADLRDADLRGANLRDADLRGADLGGADLGGADLRGANLRDADFGKGKVKSFAVFTGLYKYIVIPYILETGEHCIKMGCMNRIVKEWEEDFWNNNEEFPNDNSLKSNLRIMAFDTAKKWLELNK